MGDILLLIETLALVALIMAALIILAAGWFLLPFALRRISEARLARLCKAQKAIVLSYDDGPGPTLTRALLDLLDGRGVATFFVLGRKTEANRDTVAQAIGAGHEIASHSFHHTNAWKVTPMSAARDLAAGISAVRDLGGNANLYRPPYGKLTLATLIHGGLRRQRFGWWTIDSNDTKESRARRPISDILDEITLRGGGVVLMHDFDKSPAPSDGISHSDYVISLTMRIIEFAEQNGYHLMRLGDVLHRGQNRPQTGAQDGTQGGAQE